jgi:site-specific DNA recombinase
MDVHDISTVREYLRVSLDRRDGASVEQQHTENSQHADRLGWALGDPYRDTGSASRHARKIRDDYARLIGDLKADRFGADALVLWESSRGSRKVGEWVVLIELCEERGIGIYVTTHGRLYDPSNPRDRRSLLEDAVDSEYESEKTRQRVRRDNAAAAAEGKVHGRLGYGWRRKYEIVGGRAKLVAQEPDPVEAPVITELFDRLYRGHALSAIAASFAERGITARSGIPFSGGHLSLMAKRHAYAGLRSHHGVVVEATWPAIVEPEVFWTVYRSLTAPERKTRLPGRAVHLVSMMTRCDVCGGQITARTTKMTGGRAWAYMCQQRGCVKVDHDELEQYAERVIIAYLSDPRNTYTRDTGPDVAKLRGEAVAIEAELDELADQVGRGELSATLAARAEPAIRARLDAVRERERDLTTPGALRRLLGPGAGVAERWTTLPMSARREVAGLLLRPDVIGELRITRSPIPGHRVEVHRRVRWARVDA